MFPTAGVSTWSWILVTYSFLVSPAVALGVHRRYPTPQPDTPPSSPRAPDSIAVHLLSSGPTVGTSSTVQASEDEQRARRVALTGKLVRSQIRRESVFLEDFLNQLDGNGNTVIASAVEDALTPFGVHIAEAPISPARIVELIATTKAA